MILQQNKYDECRIKDNTKSNKMTIIETHNLNFGFKKGKLVLKDINLKVEKGSIWDF